MRTTNICRSRRRKRPRVQLEDDEFASTRTAGTKSTQLQLLQQMRHREVRGWHLKFCRRTTTVSFTRLQTPTTEAVLGLDDAGDYVFGVHEGVNCLELVQRAIPSPSEPVAPLVQRIPLPCPDLDERDDLVATVPIDILISGDVGIARIQTYQSSDDDKDQILGGSVVCFNLKSGTTATCPTVRLGGSLTTIRNFLWSVSQVPIISPGTVWSCHDAHQTRAHLFLNDEYDGFRLTWLVSPNTCYPPSPLSKSTLSPRKDTANTTKPSFIELEQTWQGDSSMIAAEAYLHIDSLLHDIRSRRRQVFDYKSHIIPMFGYHLVSVDDSGRQVKLVICFSNPNQPSMFAVVVKIDVYTQSYQEIEWAQLVLQSGIVPSRKEDRLRSYSERFALHQRMKEMCIGPFALQPTKTGGGLGVSRMTNGDWRFLLDHSSNADHDERHDWHKVRIYERHAQVKEFARSVAMATLYPDCSLFTNAPVRLGLPVQVLKCRSGKTELVYLPAS